MLSSSDIHTIKSGGFLASALVQNRDDLSLKRTLSTIESQKVQRMREIDIRRKQFLHHYRESISRSTPGATIKPREDLKQRVEAEKEEERRCKTILNERTAKFVDTLKTCPLTPKAGAQGMPFIKIAKDAHEVPAANETTTEIDSTESPDQLFQPQGNDPNRRTVGLLYKKGTELLRRRREEKIAPFVTSVNTVLENLRKIRLDTIENGTVTGKPTRRLTQHILEKYAGIQMTEHEKRRFTVPAITNSDSAVAQCENKPPVSADQRRKDTTVNDESSSRVALSAREQKTLHTTTNNSVQVQKDIAAGKEQRSVKQEKVGLVEESDSDSSPTRRNLPLQNKALQLWRTVRQEQRLSKHQIDAETKTACNNNKENNPVEVSIRIIPTATTQSRSAPSYGITGNTVSSTSQAMLNGHKRNPINSPHPSVGSPRAELCQNKDGLPSSDCTNGLKTTSNASNSACLLSVDALRAHDEQFQKRGRQMEKKIRRASTNSPSQERSRTNSVSSRHSGSKRSLSRGIGAGVRMKVSNQPQPQVGRSKTTIIVHREEDDGKHRNNSFTWNQGFKYGSESDVHQRPQLAVQSMDNVDDTTPHPIDDRGNVTPHPTADCDNVLPHLSVISQDITRNSDTLSVGERSVSTINSLSEVTADIQSGSRRTGKGRRLSIQTSGALRLWASVKEKESKYNAEREDEAVHPDSERFRSMMETLADAKAEAEEQAQRLEKVRRSSLSRVIPSGGSLSLNSDGNPSIGARDDLSLQNGQGEGRQTKRSPTTSPTQMRVNADVTDQVYKFLQKKFSNSELRRMSVPDAELLQLAGRSRNESFGRRQSMSANSSLSHSKRSCLVNSPQGRRTSMSGDQNHREVQKDSAVTSPVIRSARSPRYSGGSRSVTPTACLRSQKNPPGDISETASTTSKKTKDERSYSWAPDVSHTQKPHRCGQIQDRVSFASTTR